MTYCVRNCNFTAQQVNWLRFKTTVWGLNNQLVHIYDKDTKDFDWVDKIKTCIIMQAISAYIRPDNYPLKFKA
jgi:hypothetical protein